MSIIFNGREFAKEKELRLKDEVLKLKQIGVKPKIVSLLLGENLWGEKYIELKKKAAERLGIIMEVSRNELDVKKLSADQAVHGIMIQMPIDGVLKMKQEEIVNMINPKKDVDGLREESLFLHPTSKAVIEILQFAIYKTQLKPNAVTLVGATGMVGKPLSTELKKLGFDVIECNSKTKDLKGKTLDGNIVISATGRKDLIKEDMVNPGSILIDVGYPEGDISHEAKEKSAFYTPVPFGVGPVTIVCLFENLIEAVNLG